MRRINAALLAAILGFGCLAFPGSFAGAPASGPILVRLDKSGLERLPAVLAGLIRVHAELESGWIATFDGRFSTILRARGARFDILDAAPQGKEYFLVDPAGAREGTDLAAFGRTVPVDHRTSLFWTVDGREAREVLPAAFEIKSLSLEAGRSLQTAAEDAQSAGRIMGRLLRPPAYDSRIASSVAQVSTTALAANILALQNFQTRYASYPGCEQAGDSLYAYFTALGLRTEFDPFTFSSNRSSRNIVATLPGKASPEYVVILCAHYDSTTGSTTGPTTAPGADDNASGTAAVMEIARVLAGRSFDFTLKFICFSAEEWGLFGSKHYAETAKNTSEKILGVLNMDMIAYPDALPEDLDLFANASSEWLANRFVLCARQYAGVSLVRTVNPGVRASDHSPFWDQGYSALLAIEDYPVKNPYYHKTTDVLATLNVEFAAAVTKISLAAAAGLAQLGLQ
jgi:hypothetical protein